MSKPKTTVWDLDPHTRAKHVILRKYLDAWLPIISRYKGRVLFFDGFAGPGIYSNGEDGSPVIALKALIEHSHKGLIKAEVNFLFIEADKARADRLKQVIQPLLSALPANAKVLVQHDQYDQVVGQVLDHLDHSSQRLAPSLVFVDPFGVSGVPMKLIRRIMAVPSCEVMINFMVSYMNRFIAAPEFESHMDDILGCTTWRQGQSLSGTVRVDFLRKLYFEQLTSKTGSGAAYVRSFSMRDRKGQPIYDLFFATNHPVGIDRLKDALWKVDAFGGESFSDATDPNQVTLMSGADIHDAGLLAMLKSAFQQRSVRWSEVEERIRRSPFRILKKPILAAAKDVNSGISLASSTRGISEDAVLTFS